MSHAAHICQYLVHCYVLYWCLNWKPILSWQILFEFELNLDTEDFNSVGEWQAITGTGTGLLMSGPNILSDMCCSPIVTSMHPRTFTNGRFGEKRLKILETNCQLRSLQIKVLISCEETMFKGQFTIGSLWDSKHLQHNSRSRKDSGRLLQVL